MTTGTDLDWADCPAVEQDPQRVSGAWVFRGSRIPVAALFDQGTPVPLRRSLDGHAVATAYELAQDSPGYGCHPGRYYRHDGRNLQRTPDSRLLDGPGPMDSPFLAAIAARCGWAGSPGADLKADFAREIHSLFG